MKKIKLILIFILLVFAGQSYAQQVPEEDRIIAIVGNNVITWSDLIYQMSLYARQNHLTQLNQNIEQQILLSMIADKLMLAKADQDSILAPDEEVQKQLNYRIKALVDEFGSEKNLEEANNMTMSKIKDVLRENIRQMIKVDKLKQQKFGSGIKLTGQQIQDFFEQKKDSLPLIPLTFDLYEIARSPGITDEAKRLAREKAQMVVDSLRKGADFSEMALRYSDDSATRDKGGDLGKIKKGSTIKEFEDAALLLKPGEISDPVETPLGYHIIKLVDKAGDEFEARQILIRFQKLQSADFETINFLKNLKEQVLNGKSTFKQLAIMYSEDQRTAKDSGYAGLIPVTGLDSTEASVLKSMNIGDISDPLRLGDADQYAYYLFYVKDIYPEHKPSLEKDYNLIEKMAQSYEENVELNKWLDDLRKTIYVEVKQ